MCGAVAARGACLSNPPCGGCKPNVGAYRQRPRHREATCSKYVGLARKYASKLATCFSKSVQVSSESPPPELEFTFARDLREAFSAKGITLGGNSASELIAELFVIKVDMRRKQVDMTFSRQPVTDKKIKLNIEQVVAVYDRARREICERNIDLTGFLGELWEAYQRVLKLSDKSIGTRTIIVDCYRELIMVRQPASFRKTPSKQKFLDYPKTHFAFDMMQLRRSGQMIFDGHRLNLGTATIDVGSDSAKAMFLATDANEGQFIQHLYFTKEK